MDSALSPALDTARVAAFQGRFVGMLNDAGTMLMISIGHRTGLFDAMSRMAPASAARIAETAKLNERYVREWLGAMTVARIVEHDPAAGTYVLPVEHAASLTRAAAPENFAAFAQYIAVLGSVEDDIVKCFREGGGVPYARYHRFHEVMAEESGQTVLPALESHILKLVHGLIERLETGINVLDVGCGRGAAMIQLASRFPNSRFAGYDLSWEAIAHAAAEAERHGLANVSFEARDLSSFDAEAQPGSFDLITTFDAVHDQAKPRAVLAGIVKSLAKGGVYLGQDIDGHTHHHGNLDHPMAPFLYTISCMHCMTVSLAQGGEGLGAMWGREQATAMLRAAGFGTVEVHNLPHDAQNCYYVCRV
jgi:2-polyprenyl-3-methyl-5-hydroxy-6-metoxy-1,4-benzoquinol methylase